MKTYIKNQPAGIGVWMIASLFFLLGFASCDYIHDDLPLCKHTLSFVYTHNMKFADAFAHEMECQERAKQVELYIYDKEGIFLSSRTIAGEELKANRIELDLQPGTYRLLAWAGLNEKDYTWNAPKADSQLSDFRLTVKQEQQTVDRELLGLFQGQLTLEIPEGGETHTDFPLVKNTNKLRFILIDANPGTSLNADDFQIRATTTNGDLDAANQPVADTRLTWLPYYKGIKQIASATGTTTYPAVCAELNTLRLIKGGKGTLHLRYSQETTDFLAVDLADFLCLTQMESHQLDAQEYLDRQDEYVVTIYIDTTGGKAHCLEVIVNDWVIRLDDTNLKEEI
ncbi:FimB/Mfa2 family fimbrial subunit [Parabacteroides sp.]|uniref:FimB/Mfa2 family fimbrial subunit n=1 Tax=Parabacteroides sp. TaxID=1869337 RepID=UPI0030809E21